MNSEYKEYLAVAQMAAKKAADVILGHYENATSVDWKSDGSPVTPADRAAHDVILEILTSTTPHIPVASEEGRAVSAPRYWSVDPLDGTKEYVARTGAFVVNIALVEEGRAVIGVIHVPVTGDSYFALTGGGAYKEERGSVRPLKPQPFQGGRVRVIASARHGLDALAPLCRLLACTEGSLEKVALGSAWKFGRLAEGCADIYPRFGPTHTWDTAAGQCVVEESGGAVWVAGRRPLVYDHPRQLNPSFVAVADAGFAWPDILAAQHPGSRF